MVLNVHKYTLLFACRFVMMFIHYDVSTFVCPNDTHSHPFTHTDTEREREKKKKEESDLFFILLWSGE